MIARSRAYERDIRLAAQSDLVDWQAFEGATIVVTGATGLVGGFVADVLLMRNTLCGQGIDLVLLVRDMSRAHRRFGSAAGTRLVSWDARSGAVPPVDHCGYLIHGASMTESASFVRRPIETMETIASGTGAMLELAHSRSAHMVFISSMEVYGNSSGTHALNEHEGGSFDAMSLRSSYPQAKQYAETLCAAYAAERDVHVCVARLAQTFGSGVSHEDRRVFAEIARCCLEGRDIELATSGQKSNMYVALPDAATAVLMLAARGRSGLAYNVANERTFCTVREMSEQAALRFGHGHVSVRVGVEDQDASQYPCDSMLRLDVTRLRELGWKPSMGLMEMFASLIEDWDEIA